MKFIKIIFTLSLLLFLAPTSNAERIKITKKNGGCSGYDKVEETHDITNKNNTLFCSDPGNAQCAWNYPPIVTTSSGVIVHLLDIQNYIEEQIQSGILTGTVIWGTSGEVTAVWTEGLSTINGYEYTLVIYVNESPLTN
jgi:hypothetical protein